MSSENGVTALWEDHKNGLGLHKLRASERRVTRHMDEIEKAVQEPVAPTAEEPMWPDKGSEPVSKGTRYVLEFRYSTAA